MTSLEMVKLKVHSPKEKKHFCPDCDCAFSDRWHLNRHIARKHDASSSLALSRKFGCDSCGKKFFDKTDLGRHRLAKHNPDRVGGKRPPKNGKAPQCVGLPSAPVTSVTNVTSVENAQLISVTSAQITQPIASRYPTRVVKEGEKVWNSRVVKNYVCSFCDIEFITAVDLQKHVREKHAQDSGLGSSTQKISAGCSMKSRIAILSSTVPQYLSEGDDSKGFSSGKFQCDLCGCVFKGIWHLNRHKSRTHGPTNLLESDADSWTQDQKITNEVEGEMKVVLPRDDSSAIHPSGKSFSHSQASPVRLQRHAAEVTSCDTSVMSDETSIPVDVTSREGVFCETSQTQGEFVEEQLDGMRRGLDILIGLGASNYRKPPERYKKHTCSLCSCAFGDRWHLLRHLARKHDSKMASDMSKKFYCGACPKKFFDKTDLNRHYKAKHNPDAIKEKRAKRKVSQTSGIRPAREKSSKAASVYSEISVENSQNKRVSHSSGNIRSCDQHTIDCCDSTTPPSENKQCHKASLKSVKRAKPPRQYKQHTCNICNSSYRDRWHMLRHQARKHDSVQARDISKTFYCGACPKAFFDKNALVKHFTAKHDPTRAKVRSRRGKVRLWGISKAATKAISAEHRLGSEMISPTSHTDNDPSNPIPFSLEVKSEETDSFNDGMGQSDASGLDSACQHQVDKSHWSSEVASTIDISEKPIFLDNIPPHDSKMWQPQDGLEITKTPVYGIPPSLKYENDIYYASCEQNGSYKSEPGQDSDWITNMKAEPKNDFDHI